MFIIAEAYMRLSSSHFSFINATLYSLSGTHGILLYNTPSTI